MVNLKTHRKTHNLKNGAKLLKCEMCDYTAENKHLIFLHIECVHEEPKHKCNDCDHFFSLRTNLLAHKRSVHLKIKFKCDHCEHKASTKDSLKNHIDAVHLSKTFNCSVLLPSGAIYTPSISLASSDGIALSVTLSSFASKHVTLSCGKSVTSP